MSDKKPSSQAVPPPLYPAYPQGRVPYPAAGFNHFPGQGTLGQGISMSGQGPLGSMQNLKSNLPSSAHDQAGISRASYNSNPLMVLPSGQTVPLSAFYGQQQNSSSDQQGQIPFIPTGMFPNFIGTTNLNASQMPNFAWPYGLPSDLPALDPNRRGSWSSNDENGPITPVVGAPGHPDYYPGFPYLQAPSTATQQYIAGPIQPMKCADNKSYEMVNLDELTQRDPPIPRAVPALWTNQEELSLAKCLQNPEGITNIYIRGFMPDTTDEDLERWACRFGEIESCKAIIEQDTGKCKGFGFVLYYSPACAENCIRGFFHLGFQASYAQKSRNSRLKDLEDRQSTNIYCTGVPIDWNEADLSKHFLPFHAVSTKICRDAPSGVSKEVGFARFETRELAERVVKDFHSVTADVDGVKLYLRFADTKAQKQLKQQSQERRTWRSREYSFSVEHTPSPTVGRLQSFGDHFSPNSHTSYHSPAGGSTTFTPATSVSPPEVPGVSKPVNAIRNTAWPTSGGLASINTTSVGRAQASVVPIRAPFIDSIPPKAMNILPIMPETHENATPAKTPSPKKTTTIMEPAPGKENVAGAV